MPWDRTKPADPAIKTAEYRARRARLKAEARSVAAPCARCRGPIDYDGPYWLTINGRRVVNPRAFVAGHVIDRAAGGGHDLLQPECARCSITSGARTGARRLWATKPRRTRPSTAGRW